jgi:hypothetical protein
VEASSDTALEDSVLLGADHFLAGKILLAPLLESLAVGQTREVRSSEVALGSAIEVPVASWKVVRTADTTVEQAAARRYEITVGKRRPSVLLLDAAGWPLGCEIPARGATVRFRRVGP